MISGWKFNHFCNLQVFSSESSELEKPPLVKLEVHLLMANELKKLLDSHSLKLRKRPVEDRPVNSELTADMELQNSLPTIDEQPIIPKSALNSSSNNYIKVTQVLIMSRSVKIVNNYQ